MILTCEKCLGTTQINYELSVETSRIKYCPLCSSSGVRVRQDMDEESWFVIAESLNIPVKAAKELYSLWDKNGNFCAWVRTIRKEYASANT